MSYQFIHIESYARVGSIQKGKSTKWSIHDIANEAMRKEGNCDHVEEPQEPNIIYGVNAYEAAAMAQDWADSSVDASGRKLRKDGSCLLAGVISFPDGRSEDEWKAFRDDSVDYLKDKYGDGLKSVIEHRDESHLHIHFYAVPEIGQRFDEIHDGKKAVMEAKEENPKMVKGEQNKVYIEAMKEFQQDFYEDVAIKHGMLKTGPKRERLSRDEWSERKDYALQQSEELKNISLLKEEAIQQGKKEGFDYSVEQSKGWGIVDKITAKYAYHTNGFEKKLDEKDQQLEETTAKYRKYKDLAGRKIEENKTLQQNYNDLNETKKDQSRQIMNLNNQNDSLKEENYNLKRNNINLASENESLKDYKKTVDKMNKYCPDEFHQLEQYVEKRSTRPKGESHNENISQENNMALQQEQEEQQRRNTPRL